LPRFLIELHKGTFIRSKYEIKELRIIKNATHINLSYIYIFQLIQMLRFQSRRFQF